MNFNIVFEPQHFRVKTTITGEINPTIVLNSLRQAKEVCLQNQCFNIMIDACDIYLNSPFIDAYLLAKHFQEKTGLSQKYKCAFLIDPLYYPIERARDLETVAQNWNNHNIHVFTTLENASQWLKE